MVPLPALCEKQKRETIHLKLKAVDHVGTTSSKMLLYEKIVAFIHAVLGET